MRCRVGVGLLPLALACSFDAAGLGGAAPSASGGAESGATSSSGSTSASSSTGMVSEASTAGEGEAEAEAEAEVTGTTEPDPVVTSTTGDASSSGDAESTGPADCNSEFYKTVALVAGATVVPPMVSEMSEKGEGMVASSAVGGAGSVTFRLDVPCDGEYAVWGRVLDYYPGIHDYDPDSFYVLGGADPEFTWFYGCQTDDEPVYRWLRMRVRAEGGDCDDAENWTPTLTAGTQFITLRNRESINIYGEVAVIARLLVTNDMDYVPEAPGD